MHVLTYNYYPNEETRVIVYKARPPRNVFEEEQLEDGEAKQKTITSPPVNSISSHDPSYLTLHPNSIPGPTCGKPLKPGWGELPKPTKFGNHARRTILRVGGMLDRVCETPSEILFLTGTIPNGYDDGRITASAWSSWIVHTLKNWVNKHAPSKLDFYVWEYQKRGALHIHYAVHLPDSFKRKALTDRFHAKWVGILKRLSDGTGVDMLYSSQDGTSYDKTESVQAYAQEIYASASRYLAKYASKSLDKLDMGGERVLYAPTRWWGCSRPVLKLLRENTVSIEKHFVRGSTAYQMYDDVTAMLFNTSDICHDYESKYGNAKVTVAYQTANIGLEQCQITLHSNLSAMSTQNSSTTSAAQLMYLKAIAKRACFTPSQFSVQYTPYSATCLEKLFASNTLTICETLEIVNASQYLLWLKYRNRNSQPEWLGKAESRLTSILNWILAQRQSKPHKVTDYLTVLD